MNSNNNKVKRLKMIMDSLGMNQTEFGAKIGIPQANVSALISGNRKLTKAMESRFIIQYDINPIWFETGEGEMFLDGNGVKYTADIAIKALQEEISLLKTELGECRRLAESHIAIINSLAEQNKSLTMLLQKNEMSQKITENV